MIENHNCRDCFLGVLAWHTCLKGVGSNNCSVAIYLPYPDYLEDKRGKTMTGERAEFVRWCLKKMGVGIEHVALDYTVKCYPGKLPDKKENRMSIVRACRQYLIANLKRYKSLKAVVALGSISAEVFTGFSQIGGAEGTWWNTYELSLKSKLDHVWVGYDPLACAEAPTLQGRIFRVIFKACEEAGLQPQSIMGVPAFEFRK